MSFPCSRRTASELQQTGATGVIEISFQWFDDLTTSSDNRHDADDDATC